MILISFIFSIFFFWNTHGITSIVFSPNDSILAIIDDFHEIVCCWLLSLSQAKKSKMVEVFGPATLQTRSSNTPPNWCDAMRCDAEWRLKSLFLNSILRRVQNIIFIPHLSKNICSDVCNYPAQLLKPLMLPFTENQTNDTLFKSTFTKYNSIRGVWAVNFLLFLNYTYWAFQNSRSKVNEHRVY